MTTLMEPYLKLKKEEENLLKDTRRFRQLVGNLIYLTITRPNIAYLVDVISQFMQCPRTLNLEATKKNLMLCIRFSCIWSYVEERQQFLLKRVY